MTTTNKDFEIIQFPKKINKEELEALIKDFKSEGIYSDEFLDSMKSGLKDSSVYTE